MTTAERKQRSRQLARERGITELTLPFDQATIAKLDRLASTWGVSRAAVVLKLLEMVP